jgi:hypothetical protein
MNWRRETVKVAVPARHREPARSGEAGGPPGRRFRNADFGMRIGNLLKSSLEPENKWRYLTCKFDIINCNPKSEIEAEAYLSGTSQGPTPEDARLPARRAYSSERRTAISAVAVTPGREFINYPG